MIETATANEIAIGIGKGIMINLVTLAETLNLIKTEIDLEIEKPAGLPEEEKMSTMIVIIEITGILFVKKSPGESAMIGIERRTEMKTLTEKKKRNLKKRNAISVMRKAQASQQ